MNKKDAKLLYTVSSVILALGLEDIFRMCTTRSKVYWNATSLSIDCSSWIWDEYIYIYAIEYWCTEVVCSSALKRIIMFCVRICICNCRQSLAIYMKRICCCCLSCALYVCRANHEKAKRTCDTPYPRICIV